ncbi:680_t:CDS:2, partial [Entrophospora sp. SA101]
HGGVLEAPDEALNDEDLDKVSLLTVLFVHSMLQSWNFKYYQEVQRNEDLSVLRELTSKDEKYLQLDKNVNK